MLTFVNQKQHNLAYEIARISNESSLKSSFSAFSGGLTSFQYSMISTPIKIQFGQCPPCNSFARIFRHLIISFGTTAINLLNFGKLFTDYRLFFEILDTCSGHRVPYGSRVFVKNGQKRSNEPLLIQSLPMNKSITI